MEIVIGTKNWSTWSLRPWLALKRCDVDFVETLVPLRWDTSSEAIAAHSPTGLVPVLKDGALTVWDSLAICEYLNDRFPEAKLWPADPTARALARSAPSLPSARPMSARASVMALRAWVRVASSRNLIPSSWKNGTCAADGEIIRHYQMGVVTSPSCDFVC